MSILAALSNGEPATTIDLADRGLHYGDGLFRTVRIHGGLPAGWAAHLARLQADCACLGLAMPAPKTLEAEGRALFADDGDGVLKILLTRGAGGRGYAPPTAAEPTRLLLRYPLGPAPPEALTVGLADTRLGLNPHLAGVKHCNRLEQVLARRECIERGWDEALMRDVDGRLVCGTMSNLFLVRGQGLVTPRLDRAGVAGATRQRLLDACAEAGRDCEQMDLDWDAAVAADEVFVCNSIIGVRQVAAAGRRHWPAGPVTAWARAALEAQACGW